MSGSLEEEYAPTERDVARRQPITNEREAALRGREAEGGRKREGEGDARTYERGEHGPLVFGEGHVLVVAAYERGERARGIRRLRRVRTTVVLPRT